MKRWIIAASTAVVAALVAVLVVPGAAGSTYAAWNRSATAGATVAAGTWATAAPGEGVITPGDSGTVVSGGVNWKFTSPVSYCALLSVTGATSSPTTWTLKVRVTGAPFFGSLAGVSYDGTIQSVSAPDAAGDVVLTGAGHLQVTNGSYVVARICNYSSAEPPVSAAGANTYSVTTAIVSDGGPTNTCARVTVVGRPAQYFYTGYDAYFDWAAVLAAQYGAGTTAYNARIGLAPKVRSAAAVGPGNDQGGSGGGGATITARGGSVYSVHGTGTWTSGVRTGVTNTIDVCTS